MGFKPYRALTSQRAAAAASAAITHISSDTEARAELGKELGLPGGLRPLLGHLGASCATGVSPISSRQIFRGDAKDQAPAKAEQGAS